MDKRQLHCESEYSANGGFAADAKFCARVFDGILCWVATRAGQLAAQPCPDSSQLSESAVSTRIATKQCGTDGNWLALANYTECNMGMHSNNTALLPPGDSGIDREFTRMFLASIPIMKLFTTCGYWISILTLILCVIIIVSIKKLRCARNILHAHLFMSFILRATAYLIKESMFVNGLATKADLVEANNSTGHYITENFSWTCKGLTSTWFYFTQANYMFILMEGIYLHNLMFLNLFSENSSVLLYYIFGWGMPLCFISIWIILRIIYEDQVCWTTSFNRYIGWLFQMPIYISVIINFCLFISITRILCIKIKSMYVQHNKIKYRRLIRSTLTLLLIYAVPHAISVAVYTAVSYFKENMLELVWLVCDQTFTAFQGLLMGLIYCLLNGEVRTEVRQKIRSMRNYRERKRAPASRTISNTMQFTIPVPTKEELDLRRNGHQCRTSDL